MNTLPRHPAFWWSRIKIRWPFVIWLAAVAGLLAFYRRGAVSNTLQGHVEAVLEELAPLQTGRLLACKVESGQRVRAGDVLLRFDHSLFDARTAVERFQIERQFDQALMRRQSDLRDALLRQATVAAELEALDRAVARLAAMAERRLIDEQELVLLQARREALAAAGAMYPEMIDSLERDIRRLAQRKDDARNLYSGDSDGALDWQTLQREEYSLKAHHDGTIAEIYRRPGSVVEAGATVLTLLADARPRVIGFLPEHESFGLTVGDGVYITRAMGGGRVVKGRVDGIAPHVSEMPAAASRFMNRQSVTGRRFAVDLIEDSDFLPGESVHIHRVRPWWRVIENRWNKRRPSGDGDMPP